MLDDCRAILIFWRETQFQFRLALLVLLGTVIVAGIAGSRAWQSERNARACAVRTAEAEGERAKGQAVLRRSLDRVKSLRRRLRGAQAALQQRDDRIALLVAACERRETMIRELEDGYKSADAKRIKAERDADALLVEAGAMRHELALLRTYVEHIDL